MKKLLALTAVIGLALITAPANAVPGMTLVGAWEMNERSTGTVLHDLSGNGLHGHIGKAVSPTDRSYHAFSRVPYNAYKPQHIDVVPDNDLLDFGDKPFAVTAKFWWPRGSDRNLVQKGQGSPAGGMFKMKTSVGDEPDGVIKCLFRGSTGDSQVSSNPRNRLDDSKWHVVVCARTATETTMHVDGRLVDTNEKDPGFISNNWPLAIGGNTYCEKEGLLCNYWFGRIGFIRIWNG